MCVCVYLCVCMYVLYMYVCMYMLYVYLCVCVQWISIIHNISGRLSSIVEKQYQNQKGESTCASKGFKGVSKSFKIQECHFKVRRSKVGPGVPVCGLILNRAECVARVSSITSQVSPHTHMPQSQQQLQCPPPHPPPVSCPGSSSSTMRVTTTGMCAWASSRR